MPPIPKFPGLAKLISEAAPALAREGTESIAAKTATAEEKEFLDMLRQQMAERETFKSEFNLPTAHGTSGEKIAQHMDIMDKIELEKKLGLDFLPRSEIVSKVPDLTIKEFKPNDSLNGVGIFSHPYDAKQESYLSPNYKANEYTAGKGAQLIPIRVRGNKTFNFDNNIHHSVSDKVLTRDQSFQKLSELTGTPVDELKQLSAYDIEKLARRYPDQFENITFQGQIKTFKPESLRGQFAEYDPLKRKSGDYMSGLAGAGLIGASALSSNDAEAAPSFKGLKGLIKGVAPSLEKEAEEAAAREAFKSEFNLPLAHGTNLSRTGGKEIEEFIPSGDGSHGPGIYTAIRHPGEDPISNMYTSSIDRYGKEGGMSIPLVARGGKLFNLVPSEFEYLHPELKDIIPSRKKSFQKLSELTGIPVNELPKGALHDKYKLEQLIKQYPEHFEGMLDNENAVRIFEPKNVRSPFAKFDPAKKESGDILAGIAGATGLGAAAMSSSEARAEPAPAPTPSKDYEPRKEYETNDLFSKGYSAGTDEVNRIIFNPNLSTEEKQQKLEEADALEEPSLIEKVIKGAYRGFGGTTDADESVMNEYLRKNDPEQYGKLKGVAAAKSLTDPTNYMGVTASMGMPSLSKYTPFKSSGGAERLAEILPAAGERFKNIRALLPNAPISSSATQLPELAEKPSTSFGDFIEGLKNEFLEKLKDERGSLDLRPKPVKNTPLDLSQLTQPLPGLYLKSEKTILEKMGDRAVPEQLYYMTDKGPAGMLVSAGVKPEEIKFLKIPEFLEGKKTVSKKDLLEHIRENAPKLSIVDFNKAYSTMGVHPMGVGAGDYQYKGVQYHPRPSKEVEELISNELKNYINSLENPPENTAELIKHLIDQLANFGVDKSKIKNKKVQEIAKKYLGEKGYVDPETNQIFLDLFRDATHYGQNPNIIGHYRATPLDKPIILDRNKNAIEDQLAINKRIVELKIKLNDLMENKKIADKTAEFIESGEADMSRYNPLEHYTQQSEELNKKILENQQELDSLSNRYNAVGSGYIFEEAQSQPHHKGTRYGYVENPEKHEMLKDKYSYEVERLSSEIKEAEKLFKELQDKRTIILEDNNASFDYLNDVQNRIKREIKRNLGFPSDDNMLSSEQEKQVRDILKNDPENIREQTQFFRRQNALYKDPEFSKLDNEYNNLNKKISDLTKRRREKDVILEGLKQKSPDFPFKGDAIYELLAKLMTLDAAKRESGVIVSPTGKTMAKRFPSSNQRSGVSNIKVSQNPKGKTTLEYEGPTLGRRVINDAGAVKLSPGDEILEKMSPEELRHFYPDYDVPLTTENLGSLLAPEQLKEFKEKIKDLPIVEKQRPSYDFIGPMPGIKDIKEPITFTGEDMMVGGGRFRKIYDDVINKVLRKIGEPYKTPVVLENPSLLEEGGIKTHAGPDYTMELTPKMREDLLKYGLPLWMIPFIMNQEKSEETEESPKFEKLKKQLKQ